MDMVYIEPYSEDPIKLLYDIDHQFKIKSKLRNKISALNLSRSIFPSTKAYNYYNNIIKILGG